MKKFKFLLIIAAMAIFSTIITGCGGGGASSGDPELDIRDSRGTGYYVDSAVKGVDYRCGTLRGTTDDEGKFEFEAGKVCEFSIAGVTLRVVKGEDLAKTDKPVIVFEDNLTVAAFLQTLDADKNATNGIQVREDVKRALNKLSSDKVPENLESFASEMREKFKIDLEVRDLYDAQTHVESTREVLENKRGSYVVIEGTNEGFSTPKSYLLAEIDDDTFNELSTPDKIYVAKKLYSTIYKGIDIKSLQQEIASGKFISRFKQKLFSNINQPNLDDQEAYVAYDPSLKTHRAFADVTENYAGNIKVEIFSRLYYTPMSSLYYDEWIAYVLSQTILFSPAREVDSVQWFPEFIRNVYYRLVDSLENGKTIQQTVYQHMISQENWARFRSPEDNGREMLEIWLRNFQDEPVPVAAIALKNWRFDSYYNPSKQEDDYTFVHDSVGSENNSSVTLFGKKLNNGYDFFKMVVNHPNFMPTVVARIVDYFFPTFEASEKEKITNAILQSNPETFQDIFTQILFSKRYLFESDKLKSIEETFYPLVEALPYHIIKNSWGGRWTTNVIGLSAALDRANQQAFWNKLGRDNKLPTDSLSINYYHQFIRSGILLEQCDDPSSPYDVGLIIYEMDKKLDHSSVKNYLDGIFSEILGRRMNDIESQKLQEIIQKEGWNEGFEQWNTGRLKTIRLALDYISRLSELYRYRRIEGGAQ